MELIFWVFPSKNRGVILPPKMDGENFMEKPMNKWDDLGGFPPIFGSTPFWVGAKVV